eukprot:GHUV01051228.1.p1 GENE.GHUV01051228.1~~GHUV01051228.1.p1  ORF type:complete len:141 (+),score=28.62 GHUV01051228.1:85-507(+)
MAAPLRALEWLFSSASSALCADWWFSAAKSRVPVSVLTVLLYYNDVCSPAAILLVMGIVEVVLSLIHRRRHKWSVSRIVLTDRLLSSTLAGVYFFLPFLVRTSASMFACIQIDSHVSGPMEETVAAEDSFWVLDTNQQCY